jgi:hypothetical protein
VRRRRCEVEIAPIVFDGIHLRERQRKIADRLIRHLRERLRHDFRFDELRRLGVLALSEQTPDFGERAFRVGVHRIVRSPRPQRVFVQLQSLVHDAAEDHRAEMAVADRERAHPLGGARLTALARGVRCQQRVIGRRGPIPQAERGRGRRRFAGQAR